MADKIVKAFEALRSHYLHESTQAVALAQKSVLVAEGTDHLSSPNPKKKDVQLSIRERINFCNVISDFLPMQTVKDINEFPRLLTLAMELLLVSCDDEESDVRLVAGESINKIMKAFLDSNIGRIQVELYKEIKKNGSSRSLRAAMQRFGDTSHLIRNHKRRPYVANMLPCIVKIVKRDDDPIQECLGTLMLRIVPILGGFMTEADVKILLKAFLPNLKSSSAVQRRTAASSLNALCQNSRKPLFFYSWIINMLLGMITPLTNDLAVHTILGVLICLRCIVPHLDSDQTKHGIKGSFGAKQSPFSPTHGAGKTLEKKKYLQIYEVTMFCTRHKDHNVVTAALENLYQILQCQAKPLVEILLSTSGIAPTITGQLTSNSEIDTTDSPAPSEYFDSGLSSEVQSLSSLSLSSSDIRTNVSNLDLSTGGESGLSDNEHPNTPMFSAIPKITSIYVNEEDVSLTTMEGDKDEEENESEGLRLPRTYTNGSMVEIEGDPLTVQRERLESNFDDIQEETGSQSSIDELLRNESICSTDVRVVIERQFNIDAVACTGVPLLNCIRLLCSFLLSGEPGKILPDSSTRVSVKSLALHCIGASLNLYPEALLAKVLPKELQVEGSSKQLIRDILLMRKHDDPQIRGSVAAVIGHFIQAAMKTCMGNFKTWTSKISQKYETERLAITDCLNVIISMFKDESAVAIKQNCLAARNCIFGLIDSDYNLYAYELVRNLIHLNTCSYWLVKSEILDIFHQLDYKLLLLLEPHWIELKQLSSLNKKFVNIQAEILEVLTHLLGDEDSRVRQAAASSITKIIPKFYITNNTNKENLLYSAFATSELKNEKYFISCNLSAVLRKIFYLKHTACSKYMAHGCTHCLYMLSEAFPPSTYLQAWEVMPTPPKNAKNQNQNFRSRLTTGLLKPTPVLSAPPVRKLNFGVEEEIGMTFGVLNVTLDLMSAGWMMLDLQSHQDALKLCVHIFCGACLPLLKKKTAEVTEIASSPNTVDVTLTDSWSAIEDKQLVDLAKRLFSHITRVLHVLMHVLNETNPSAGVKISTSFIKEKEKTVPGNVTSASPNISATPSANNTPQSVSPRKFGLPKAMQRKQEHEVTKTGDDNAYTPTGDLKPAQTATPLTPQGPEKNERLGSFHNIPQFMKLYEILKGAYKNYQTSSVFNSLEKFNGFVRGILESFSLFLELATFNELGSHAEEFLDYLKATAHVEEEITFLAVQQLLKGLFGTNAASDPEVYKLPSSIKQMLITHGDSSRIPEHSDDNHTSFPYKHHSANFYDECFSLSFSRVLESLKSVPVADPVIGSLERGSKAMSMLKSFKKSFSNTNRPIAKVSKERVASIQSYIRLFEPLVIHALKSYTTTSSVTLQCQAIHLLDQLIRLRVNYSLLDSDQVFIGFVLKQFEFITNGQIQTPETFIPTVFQFLVLLSYECYQPKFTQAKAIIGMPRIMRLCDEIMACEQPPITHAIPALRPIVYDLFNIQCQTRPDSAKDLDTQREVVVSMLLRVVQYPEVLHMLTLVLRGSKSDDEKWKRLSRVIIDTLLPSLSKLQVQVNSTKQLQTLFALMDAVAPLALRPGDIILKPLLDIQIPTKEEIPNALCTVIALLRTLIMQNKEDTILSRIQQLDSSYIRPCFFFMNDDGKNVSVNGEHETAKFFALYLLYFVSIASEDINQNFNLLTNERKRTLALVPLLEMFLMMLSYIGRSGLFKVLSSNLLILVKQDFKDSVSFLDSITYRLSKIRTQVPLCFLKWLYCLQSFGLSDESFWKRQFTGSNSAQISTDQVSWKSDLVEKGALLLYSDILLSQLKEKNNLNPGLIVNLLNGPISTLILNFDEPPVKELISRILQNSELAETFLGSISKNSSSSLFQQKFLALKWLLHHVECVDLVHSNAVIQFLLKILPHLKIYGFARKAETLTCRRVDYIQSLPENNKSVTSEMLMTFATATSMRKSYPRLCSSIDRFKKKTFQEDTIRTHPLDSPTADMRTYMINKKWMFQFVEQLCLSSHENETEKKSTIRLLRSLNLEDITTIMQNDNFDKELLETCINEAYFTEEVQMQNPRSGTNSARLDLHENFASCSTERENKDRLLALTKQIVLKHIELILPTVTGQYTYRNHSYFAYKFDSLMSLANDVEKRKVYVTLIKCIIKFLSPSCYQNKLWNLNEEMGLNVMKLILMFPIMCCNGKKKKQDIFLNLELCFNVTALLFHCQELSICLTNQSCAYILTQSIDSIYTLVKNLALPDGKEIANLTKRIKEEDSADAQGDSIFHTSCEQVSDLVDSLQNITSIYNTKEDRLPKYLACYLRQTIVGLSRLPFINSYVRVPPVVWKFGWSPAMEGTFETELPPLPVDILKEKDVLKEFVYRVNQIGWTSRMQYEETWAALLGVLSSPPVTEDSSIEEEIELAEASCLAVHCITSLLLETTLAPVPGNSAISRYSVIHRSRDFPFMGTTAGKKLLAIRSEIEMEFNKQIACPCSQINTFFHPVVPSLLSSKQRKQHLINGYMMESKLYVSNLEIPYDLDSFNIGQISACAIRTRLVTSDVQEDTDSDDSDSLIIQVNKEKTPTPMASIDTSITTYRKVEELDIRSCLQFLLELYEQWLSIYAVPRTPLMLKMEAIKSLCVLSDFLLELNHYEWVLGILLDFSQSHALEDDILSQYLIPTVCKALAILKMEGPIAERIVKLIEVSLKSPHLPLQVSCLAGSLYILESFVSSTNILLVPILTEILVKKLPSAPEGTSPTDSKRYTIMIWTVAFYLLENFSSEIQDPQFAASVLELAINELCKVPERCCPGLLNVLFRGLERLAVSFSLTRAECERLAKVSANCISIGSSDHLISALGLLCTCMYTGKAEQASGLSTVEPTIDTSINDLRLIVMERTNVLLSRIRKGHLAEANLLATILPRILLDFLSVQEVMNKLISEFLSSQQPRPELIAKIFNKVAELLFKEGEEAVVRDWVFLCIGSFVQRTPLSMAVWSLTCFFISSSSNPWLKSIFPYIVERKGKMDNRDRVVFVAAAKDFYTNQNLDATQKKQFIQTFRSKADAMSPYELLLSVCLSDNSSI